MATTLSFFAGSDKRVLPQRVKKSNDYNRAPLQYKHNAEVELFMPQVVSKPLIRNPTAPTLFVRSTYTEQGTCPTTSYSTLS